MLNAVFILVMALPSLTFQPPADTVVPHQACNIGLLMLERFGWPKIRILQTNE
jgi:hypothetical protein